MVCLCARAPTAQGSALLTRNGTLNLLFDNSYSMLTSKTIKYSAIVTEENHGIVADGGNSGVDA